MVLSLPASIRIALFLLIFAVAAMAGSAPKQGQACDAEGRCAQGLTCVRFYGIAGPRGPQFTSCEIPCPDTTSTCPPGQTCTTVADGPGRVCRPSRSPMNGGMQ